MKIFYTKSTGKPYKGVSPNDRRNLNLKGKSNGKRRKN
jgi:hypothetical protein